MNVEIKERDDIGKEIQKNALAQMKSEIDGYTKALEQTKKELDRFEKQCIRDLEKFEIMVKEFEYIAEPRFAFEKNPRYWELVKGEKIDEIEMEKAKINGYKERKLKEMEELQKIISETQSKYNDLKSD